MPPKRNGRKAHMKRLNENRAAAAAAQPGPSHEPDSEYEPEPEQDDGALEPGAVRVADLQAAAGCARLLAVLQRVRQGRQLLRGSESRGGEAHEAPPRHERPPRAAIRGSDGGAGREGPAVTLFILRWCLVVLSSSTACGHVFIL